LGSKPAKTTKALLLAAGLGTRLRPLTNFVPKCLIEIAGRPLLDYWFDRLAEARIRDVLINTHHLAEQVRAYIEQKNNQGVFNITETHEPKLLGSAGTIHANRDFLADDSDGVIIYADNLSNVDLASLVRFHRSHNDPITMMLFRAPRPEHCGVAELDATGRVIGFTEKPKKPKSDLANAGVYVVSASAYREIADMNKLDLAYDVLPAFVGRMRGWVWDGYHLDIGTPEALTRARADAPKVFPSARHNRLRPAVFLDRDGTIIEHVHHLTDPADVRLVPGAAEAIVALRLAGYACVVVTNQSVIGRGMLTEEGLRRVHDEMCRQLAERGAVLDGIYHCPIVPRTDDPTVVEHPDRKPGPGMLLRAARELGIDLSRSWMVGDSVSDILAGRNAGCRGTVLIGNSRANRDLCNVTEHTARNLIEAAHSILSCHRSARKRSDPRELPVP